MILFFISFILIFLSSYLITSVISEKKSITGLIYFFLIPFANIVLTFEVLSLFSAISQVWVLVLNIIVFLISAFVWNKFQRPLWSLDWKPFFRKIFNAMKLDKYLAVLFIGFIIMVSVSLFLVSFMPVVNPDASAYHVLRSLFWISNGNLSHFVIADSRNLVLPINSEILYAWVLLFVKKQVWFGFFAFVGYLLSIVSIYGLMGFARLSTRKKLWVTFLLSSFAAVIVQLSGTETDIIIAGLVISSLSLYYKGVKSNKIIPIFMASLAYALAIGTKTPAIMAIPAIGLAMIALGIYYKKKDFYKPFLIFLGFALVNFILFASYNYILNFLDYGNIAGSDAFMFAHRSFDGLRAIPANFIKYLFLFFDFTGFKWGDYIGADIIAIRNDLLSLLNLSDISDGLYTTANPINQSLYEPLMGLGILGFLVYLPCMFWALIKPIFKRNRQTIVLFVFALIFIINLIVMSYELQFMVFSIRFLMFFCLISAPVMAYSYCKKNNPYKFIVVMFALFYLIFVSTHLWARPFKRIVRYFKAGYTVSQVREIASCAVFLNNPGNMPEFDKLSDFYNEDCTVKNYIQKTINKENKILFFSGMSHNLLLLKLMDFDGYKIDYGVQEDVNNVDLDKYNLIITVDNGQFATNVLHYEMRKNDVYVNPQMQAKYYRKNKENPCFYMDTDNQLIVNVNDPLKHPYMSSCVLKDEFFDMHHYKLIDTLAIDVPSKEKDENEEIKVFNYYFYENQKNPLKP